MAETRPYCCALAEWEGYVCREPHSVEHEEINHA